MIEIDKKTITYHFQDDCSKRLLCELNAKAAEGNRLTENEEILANAFGKRNNLDVGAETLEFDVAAVLGRKVRAISTEAVHFSRDDMFYLKFYFNRWGS